MLMTLLSLILFAAALAVALAVIIATIVPALPRMAALLAEECAGGGQPARVSPCWAAALPSG